MDDVEAVRLRARPPRSSTDLVGERIDDLVVEPQGARLRRDQLGIGSASPPLANSVTWWHPEAPAPRSGHDTTASVPPVALQAARFSRSGATSAIRISASRCTLCGTGHFACCVPASLHAGVEPAAELFVDQSRVGPAGIAAFTHRAGSRDAEPSRTDTRRPATGTPPARVDLGRRCSAVRTCPRPCRSIARRGDSPVSKAVGQHRLGVGGRHAARRPPRRSAPPARRGAERHVIGAQHVGGMLVEQAAEAGP